MPDKHHDDSLQERLVRLRQAYFKDLPRKLQRIESGWERLSGTPVTGERLKDLRQQVHNLAGSSGTFEFPGLSRAAQELELMIGSVLDQETPLTKAQRDKLQGRMEALAQVARDTDPDETADKFVHNITEPLVGPEGSGLLFIVDDDPDVSGYLGQNLRAHGFEVRQLQTLKSLQEAVEEEHPAVILMDIIFPEGELAGVEAIAELRKSMENPPAVLFLSSRSDMIARLEAMRAGADAYLTKPVDIPTLVSKLSLLISPSAQAEPYRVLVVDDDRSQALYCAAILKKAGMLPEIITDPMTVMGILDTFVPDLILLDLYMPKVGGLELASVIRQREDLGDIPIVFLSGETDAEKRFAALSLGADDFLTKPITPPHLVSAVRNRILRSRAMQAKLKLLARQDRLTGLYNRDYLLSQLERIVDQVVAGGLGRALVYLSIDNFKELSARLGMRGGDRVVAGVAEQVRRAARAGDLLGRYSGASFIVALRSPDLDAARIWADGLRAQVERNIMDTGPQSVSVTVSLGIVGLGSTVPDAATAVMQANQACHTAQELGGNRVQVYQATEGVSLRADAEQGWVKRVEAALNEDGLRLVYQPIVNLHGEQAPFYEIFVRLLDEEGAEVPAARFIPVAERNGLMPRVDRWVLQHAVRAAAGQHRNGNPVRLFVTLSATTVGDTGLLAWVADILKEARLPNEALVIQCSARDAEDRLKPARELIDGLHDLGVATGLSHFGGGGAPLSLLNHLNPDYIKFDQQLVRESLAESRPGATLRELISTTRALGKQSIVPFVEEAATLATLWSCGVDYVQGYFVQGPDAHPDYDFVSATL
ncbi:EAL domain-containing protein [Thioalbus denitrificans]|uniref:Diguanylate cyclase (GGDEF)-like protein n=1 Tax=Thioalbus denitrificans TaxID=547122 RepID=A0A369C9B0_9GAMM|nr:EAL domain-containing protein [Thioalbus denitrificans]RCX30313.1 diguanylate cyclase (GGDEF)-like protein [Thioalbus denitrificans]